MENFISSLLLVSRASDANTTSLRSSVAMAEKPWSIIPTKRAIKRFRGGSLIGRVGRHIFEHNLIHRVLGTQIALAAVATSIINTNPNSALNQAIAAEPVALKASQVSLVTNHGIQAPLTYMKVNQGYRFYHPGLDLEGNTGDPVKPVMPGTVAEAGYSRLGYGNAVVVDHGNGITTLYAHLSKIEVAKGDHVSMTTEIGKVGSTGRSTGDHLHLEIRENGKAINPLSILPK